MDQDVLGYDNETSMNHNWDPRFQIFIDSNYLPRKDELTEFFKINLPPTLLEFSKISLTRELMELKGWS